VLVLALAGGVVAIGGVLFAANEVADSIEDGTGVNDVIGFVGGECVEFQLAYTTLAFTGMFGAGASEEQREELERSLGDLRDMAPEEIRDEFEIVADAYQEAMSIVFQPGNLTSGEGPSEADSRRAEEILESPEVVEAQETINDWLNENCS
jgi:hypothetical protein